MKDLKPLKYKEFSTLTPEEQKQYITEVNKNFGASRSMFAYMLGISPEHMRIIAENIGYRFQKNYHWSVLGYLRFGQWLGENLQNSAATELSTSDTPIEEPRAYTGTAPLIIPDNTTSVTFAFPGGVTCTVSGGGNPHE